MQSQKNQRIGFEISTLEIKSKALSMAGVYFSVKVAFTEMTQHEDTAKRQSRDGQKERTK